MPVGKKGLKPRMTDYDIVEELRNLAHKEYERWGLNPRTSLLRVAADRLSEYASGINTAAPRGRPKAPKND